MTLQTYQIGDVTVVRVPGPNLDISNAGEFRAAMSTILQDATKVVLDLDAVEFLDSSGLGTFISCLRQLNAAGGDLKLARMRKPVSDLFKLVRMHRVFDISDTPEQAAAVFQSAS